MLPPVRATTSLLPPLALAALAVTGCGGGTSSPAACLPAAAGPVTIGGPEHRAPVVAADARGEAVAAWESDRGGRIQAASRSAAGAWSKPRSLSGPDARDPAVAIEPSGAALVVWQDFDSDNRRVVRAASRSPGGRWSRAAALSAPAAEAREATVGMDARGGATVAWSRSGSGDQAVIEVVHRPPGGVWSAPLTLGRPSDRSRAPHIAVNAAGDAALVWRGREGRRSIVHASVRIGGRWSPSQPISPAGAWARQPDAGIDAAGRALAVWLLTDARDQDGQPQWAERTAHGAWSAPRALSARADAPFELSRPTPSDNGPRVAVAPSGAAVAVWQLGIDGTNRVEAAARGRGGSWSRPATLSRGGEAGEARVVIGPSGGALAAWEELAGDDFRIRAARAGADGAWGPCRDVSRRREDAAGLEIDGPPGGATAVWVGTNRETILAGRPGPEAAR